MAIDDYGGGSDSDITWSKPKGKPVNASNTHAKIVSQLSDNGRGWFIINLRDHPRGNIRAEDYLKIFDKNNRAQRQAYGGDPYITLLEKPRPINNTSSGGSGTSQEKGKSNSLDICAMCGSSSGSQLNTEPTVNITEPKNGIEINLSDKNYFNKNIVTHTVQEGETAESIVKKITGKTDLSAIIEMKPKSYHQGDKVLSGYELKIENGLALKISGSVTNCETVNITSTGAITGSELLNLGKSGVNEYVNWVTYIPVSGIGTVSIKAKASSAIAVSENEITPLHWLEIQYQDENNKPVPDISFQVTCKNDGKKFNGELNGGAAKVEGLTPGSVDVEFIHDYDKRQKKLRKELKTEFDNAIAYAKQESERLEKEWAKQPWWNKPVILGGVVITGTMEWVTDTVTGVYSIIDAVNKTGSKAIVMSSRLAAHKAQLFEAYYSNDTGKIETEKAAIKAIQTDMGESIDSAKESLESLAILATDSEIYKMLYEFPGTYFDALSFTEKTHFVFRYGIDIALAFVGGAGLGILAVKNSAKITAILKKATELIKLKRFKQAVKGKKTNTTVKIEAPPVKKIDTAKLAGFEVQAGGKVLKAEAIREGTNGKVAVIGRSMGDRPGQVGVLEYANALKKQDKYKNVEVETFSESIINDAVNDDFKLKVLKAKNKRGANARLTDAELLKTKMYTANKEWAQKLKDEGYTVIDIGDPNKFHDKIPPEFSVFYKMEKNILF